ncbi:hypothetical protein ABT297_34730 [Dactylosporangium sp. NPDC000555]|uniref:hypothetical protein n=1 Tax=Dactylosporangium sp. NPDC000555 TaxID=3154260 RepID=UPI00332778D1
MSSTVALIIAIIVVVLVIAGLATMALGRHRRTKALRRRFGPEYDRAVAEQPSRRAAERELQDRERRHAGLELKELAPWERRRYAEQWARTQAHFVEEPEAATREADALVTKVMAERGYPVEDFDARVQDLSVEHAETLDHYRDAHEINKVNERGQASTEQLRQALMHYRVLFAELLGEPPGGRPAPGHG